MFTLSRKSFVGLAVAAAVILFIPGVTAAQGRPALQDAVDSSDSSSSASFSVDGEVANPLQLTVGDLRKDYRTYEATSPFTAGCVTQGHRYRGARLADVLMAARPTADPEVKGDMLRHAVLVDGSDGYEVALSWGELDPKLSDAATLLVFEQDGELLSRPHLVVSHDQKGFRYVCDIARISFVLVKR